VRAAGQPPTVAMLAAMAALQTSLSVFGPRGEARLGPSARAWGVAALAVGLAALLAPYTVARYAAFVLVLAGAVWARRFTGGFGMGMVAFNAYLFAGFIRATPAQLPWLLVALAMGVAAAALVRRL